MTLQETRSKTEALFARGGKALVVYLTAYDPDRQTSLALLRAAAENGADLLEVGVPFSDPSADGPVIQRAMLRGLEQGASLAGTLGLVWELRSSGIQVPVVLFGYYNPILTYGIERFCKDARAAQVDGVLVVDLPKEEADEVDGPLFAQGLYRVPLLSPLTDANRAAYLTQGMGTAGFAYYVALTGVTGARHFELDSVRKRVAALRPVIPMPLAVGFGVKDPQTAKALAGVEGCDAVVVGSALIEAHEEAHKRGQDPVAAVAERIRALAQALKTPEAVGP